MPKIEVPYKIHELAILLRKSDDGVRKLLQRGDIKGVKVGRQWRIPYDEVCRICKECAR